MRRKLFNFVAAVSLVLFLATAVSWPLSYRYAPMFNWRAFGSDFHIYVNGGSVVLRREFKVAAPPDAQVMEEPIGHTRCPIPGLCYYKGRYVALRDGVYEIPGNFGNTGEIWFPAWWQAMIAAVLPLIGILRLIRNRGRSPHDCPRCGYNLTGNTSGVCPECGTPVAGKAGATL